MTDINREDIVALRQQNIGRLFQRAARAYSELALQKAATFGYEGMTLFHTALISNLDEDGTRITTLAHRAGISKQAMGQLVKELEAKGYIERKPDLEDKRATLVVFTEQGWQLLQDVYQVKLEIEAEYTAVLGEENMAMLWQLLNSLLENGQAVGE